MDTTRMRQARRLFSSPYVHRNINRSNARKWVRALRGLGPRWVGLSHRQVIEWRA